MDQLDISQLNEAELQAEVLRANREVYDTIDIDLYERNPSLFEHHRQAKLRRMLIFLSHITRGERMLDIGCGSGNILKLARDIFPTAIGCDVGYGILRQLQARDGALRLLVADAGAPPFPPESFDVITFNGVLHHIPDPVPVFREVVPLLREGGALYTDHDVSCYFGRYYRVFNRLRGVTHGGFRSRAYVLSEYHNSQTGGLDPLHLARALKDLGCRRVRVGSHNTSGKHLSAGLRSMSVILRMLGAATDARSFFSHFTLLARK